MEKLNPEFKLSFYVPESHLEQVKQALFKAGAGKLGYYEQVCWQTRGLGQFCPQEEANPAIGEKHELTYVEEFKVEMLCCESLIHHVIKTLQEVHPYEEPAYDIIRLVHI
ncbi:hypothetical protein [Legionella spiritensis]|uniref:Structural toxin protein (Hemagglutinin/hemolysin) RtxA n=1 Tax=Legionella spiritensis TaxID=452 RepID=A0A0W0Z483_LEGSP|nr:hypothetical protein [Legionella spiritensis]KTD63932.1 structural toxin protein (hemagglutinin/hemolysin) RtxA [Legionella spiritensis]SNV36638.1 structural toxin protein (hemagglutinin/hemolysin) RtxA [Legionella spiritensis]VEG89967.1 structural toxin protein (hemagglutinin/hemolysin) RtxA [Legionella spiritensis]